MADDYIVIPSIDDDKTISNPAKETEKADSAARDDGKNTATQTIGAADSCPHDEGKNLSKTAKQIDGGIADLGTGKNGNKSAKTARGLELLSAIIFTVLLFLPIILALVAVIISCIQENAKGPQFQIHSSSVSTFSISWWSETITADWNLSLGVKNLNSQTKFSYDFMQVSIFYGDTHLSTTMLTPFRQVPLDQLLLNVNFPSLPAKIDASVSGLIKEAKRLNNSMYIDVVIRAKISRDNGRNSDDMKWSKSLTASCKNIELQFSSDGEKAKMIPEEPIVCEFSK